MILVAMLDRNEPDKVVQYLGVAEDLDAVFAWYRTHSKFSAKDQEQFERRWLKEGFLHGAWVTFGEGSIYGIRWVSHWNAEMFDKELKFQKKS